MALVEQKLSQLFSQAEERYEEAKKYVKAMPATNSIESRMKALLEEAIELEFNSQVTHLGNKIANKGE